MNIKKTLKSVQKRVLKSRLGKIKITRRRLIVAAGILLLVLVIGRARAKRSGISVETQKAEISTITQGFTTSGEVKSSEIATLTFSTGGQVSWVGIKEGDRIYAGESLASLNTTQLSLQLKKLLNNFDRQFTLFDDSNDSVKDEVLTDSVKRIRERAQIDLDQTVLDVEIQNEAIRLATIVAPFNGVVTQTYFIFPGMNVTPGNQVATVANPDRVYFEADVNEVDIVNLSIGDKVEVTLDAYPDETFEGEITSIGFDSVTTSTGGTAYKVKISLPVNTDMKFKLGMGGDADFILATKEEVIVVPQTAIVEDGGKTYVWIDEDGVSKRIEVTTGAASLTQTEVVSGLTEGQTVILRPSTKLTEGSKVRLGK